MDTVTRIEQEAGIKRGAVPPVFQYRPIDTGLDETPATVIRDGIPASEFLAEVTPKPEPVTTAQGVNADNNQWDENMWQGALKSGGKYIKIDDAETRVLKFMSNDPTVSINKFNRKAWDFDVMDENGEQKVISVTNVALMGALYRLLPILYTNVQITRIGTGAQTRYVAKIIPNTAGGV